MSANRELYEKERNERFVSEFGEKIHRCLTDVDGSTHMAIFRTGKDTISHNQHWGTTGFPMNGASQKLLGLHALEQGYKDMRWFRYDQAQASGGQVKANSQGVTIRDYNRRLSQAYYPTIFNAEQIKGLPQFEPLVRPSIDEAMDGAQKLLDTSKVPVAFVSDTKEPMFDKDAGRICLAPLESFHSIESYYVQAVKGVVQGTAHPDAMDRFVGDSYKARAMEAFKGNVATAMICDRLGLNAFALESDQRFVKVWAEVAQEDPEALVKAFAEAERICYHLEVFAPRLAKTPLVEQTEEQREALEQAQEKIAEIEQASQEKSRKQARSRTKEREHVRSKVQAQGQEKVVKRTTKRAHEQEQSYQRDRGLEVSM